MYDIILAQEIFIKSVIWNVLYESYGYGMGISSLISARMHTTR